MFGTTMTKYDYCATPGNTTNVAADQSQIIIPDIKQEIQVQRENVTNNICEISPPVNNVPNNEFTCFQGIKHEIKQEDMQNNISETLSSLNSVFADKFTEAFLSVKREKLGTVMTSYDFCASSACPVSESEDEEHTQNTKQPMEFQPHLQHPADQPRTGKKRKRHRPNMRQRIKLREKAEGRLVSSRELERKMLEEKYWRVKQKIISNFHGGLQVVHSGTREVLGLRTIGKCFRKGAYLCTYSGELLSKEQGLLIHQMHDSDDAPCYCFFFSYEGQDFCINSNYDKMDKIKLSTMRANYGRLLRHKTWRG